MYQQSETNGLSLGMVTGLHLETQNVSKNK